MRNGCKVIGFFSAFRILQLRVTNPAKSLSGVMETLKTLPNVNFVGPNQILKSSSMAVDVKAVPGESMAGLEQVKYIPEAHVPYDLMILEPKDEVTWHPSDFAGDYWVEMINAPDAWAISTGSTDIWIGIVDIGFEDWNTIITPSRITRMFYGGTAGSFDFDIFPLGRWVMPFAAGDGDNTTLNALGVAWKNPVTVVSWKKYISTAGITGITTDFIAALDRTVAEGVRVVNVSAGPGLSPD